MRRLRAGVIGLGVGEFHVEGYQKHPACEVVALCDFSEERLARARKKYPDLKLTPHVDEVLEDPGIDVVSIASYDNYHAEQVEKGIRNNKHLFVEKPLCLNEQQAKRIRTVLREKPALRLSSNLILRLCPRFQQLRRLIGSGDLGDLFYIEGDYNYGRLHKLTEGWRGQVDGYSVVHGGAIHVIDLLLWLTGESVVEVCAYGNQIASAGSKFQSYDLVVSILKFQGGLLGKVSANCGCVFPHFHRLSVYGTKASFVNDFRKGLLFEMHGRSYRSRNISADYPGVQKGDLVYSFVQSILDGSQAVVTVEDVFKTMSVCFAIEKAARQSGPVAVEYL